jgi:hypothetical protein
MSRWDVGQLSMPRLKILKLPGRCVLIFDGQSASHCEFKHELFPSFPAVNGKGRFWVRVPRPGIADGRTNTDNCIAGESCRRLFNPNG